MIYADPQYVSKRARRASKSCISRSSGRPACASARREWLRNKKVTSFGGHALCALAGFDLCCGNHGLCSAFNAKFLQYRGHILHRRFGY